MNCCVRPRYHCFSNAIGQASSCKYLKGQRSAGGTPLTPSIKRVPGIKLRSSNTRQQNTHTCWSPSPTREVLVSIAGYSYSKMSSLSSLILWQNVKILGQVGEGALWDPCGLGCRQTDRQTHHWVRQWSSQGSLFDSLNKTAVWQRPNSLLLSAPLEIPYLPLSGWSRSQWYWYHWWG